ncbi:LPS export ABC transporter periplasmic protein LptC [Stakelama saccharophila]|uniref:LPS export ABC transporter periplasmic protein LptC n=1 Tax=Stakelama saccharophila TaxID=3075605 RepID=A0ABZ0BA24_9SPHN|nr:LPS export ABC transporter periplasmic protein LptC [Stakelama sp. W311]WNO54260.1 LPS export ABC transporter periplasmic protein LptC [Stakelama sp. W311]
MSDIARRVRSERQNWAAPGSTHDRVVAIMQVVLPMGIGALAAFLVLAPLVQGGDVSFLLAKDKVDVAGERMRLQAARYRGEDSEGRPFLLSAKSAVQESSTRPVVQMRGLAAQLRLSDGPARIVAEQGRYDMDAEEVRIDGPIRVRAPDDYRIDTSDAVVDLKARKLESTGPASGSSSLGTFSGDRMSADLESRTIHLDGDAHLRIVPGRANRR